MKRNEVRRGGDLRHRKDAAEGLTFANGQVRLIIGF